LHDILRIDRYIWINCQIGSILTSNSGRQGSDKALYLKHSPIFIQTCVRDIPCLNNLTLVSFYKTMLLSIVQGYKDTIILDVAGFQGIHAVGVPNGVFSIQGVTPTIGGEFEAHRWKDRKLKYPDTLSLRLIKDGKPTKPDHIEKTTVDESKKRIESLFKELDAIQERAKERNPVDKKPSVTKTNIVEVLKNGEPVFHFEGEHVQFDINWDLEDGCQILVWGFETYESEQQNKTCFDVRLNEDEEYIIRFGS